MLLPSLTLNAAVEAGNAQSVGGETGTRDLLRQRQGLASMPLETGTDINTGLVAASQFVATSAPVTP
jgi:hypothetical protein